MLVTATMIRQTIQDLGLTGRPLCVHSSLRSFGRVEGGAATVVEALLAEGCTVLTPSFSHNYAIAPPPELRPARNGCDEAGLDRWREEQDASGRALPVYSPETLDLDRADMGAIPAAVVGWPGRVRGRHPLNSFCAVGPLAETLLAGQAPLAVYAPLTALAEAGGSVVLMGVGLERMTPLHLAEQMAGRTLFRRWACAPDGRAMMVEVGGCSAGFGELEPVLAPFLCRACVGWSDWRVYPLQAALARAAQAFREDPARAHCGDPTCDRCNDGARGGPLLDSIPI